MSFSLYHLLQQAKNTGEKLLFQLIDPDKFDIDRFYTSEMVDFYLVGGSVITKGSVSETVSSIKLLSGKKVYLFPGDISQLTDHADGLLLLSLIFLS